MTTMHMADPVSSEASAWSAPHGHAGTAADQSRRFRSRRSRDDPTSFRAIIVSSVFLVLFSVSLMLGGHAAIDPLLRSAMAARDTKEVGDIVMTMPDGKFCRHMSFDNATSEIIEGRIGPCPDNATRREFRSYRGFAWGVDAVPPPAH